MKERFFILSLEGEEKKSFLRIQIFSEFCKKVHKLIR
jgi:hypothetical protein